MEYIILGFVALSTAVALVVFIDWIADEKESSANQWVKE